jgi:hypothetical protein
MIYSNITLHLYLSLTSGLFHPGFMTKILYALVTSPMRATCHSYPFFLDLMRLIIFGEAYKLWSSHYAVFSSLSPTTSPLGPNILLSTLFSNTFKLCSFSVRDQVSWLPYKITDKITVTCDNFPVHCAVGPRSLDRPQREISKQNLDVFWRTHAH